MSVQGSTPIWAEVQLPSEENREKLKRNVCYLVLAST
jgi:hypothetical protein